jgi:hypothetical protein
MNRPEFERVMATLRERIAGLPDDQRAELERLAEETCARHDEISRDSLRAHRAAERLELGFERMRAACEGLAKAASDARAALDRAPGPGARPAPGVN